MKHPSHTETPCGCAFCRGLTRALPMDCLTHRTPAERAAYVARLLAPSPIDAPAYTPRASRPIHAYANGGRP
jgi:hypothetical protein